MPYLLNVFDLGDFSLEVFSTDAAVEVLQLPVLSHSGLVLQQGLPGREEHIAWLAKPSCLWRLVRCSLPRTLA